RQRGGRPMKGRAAADAVVHAAEILVAMVLVSSLEGPRKITERLVMDVVATAAKLPFVELDPLKLDAKLAPQFLSRPFARRHTALVIAATDTHVTFAVADPLNPSLVDDLVNYVRRRPTFVIACPSDIQRLITDFYGFRTAVAAAEEQVGGGVDIG